MLKITRTLLLLTATLPTLLLAHGYLSSPPPRGIQKAATEVDALKPPNFGGRVCRGEPEGQITQVTPGGSLTLDFTITAPHIGPCTVYLLDPDLNEATQKEIASKNNCAAPGKVEPWTIDLPSGVSGRKVLRWYWEAQHVSPSEPYEQCVDLVFGPGSDSASNFGSDSYSRKSQHKDAPVNSYRSRSIPRSVPPPALPASPQYGAEDEAEAEYESAQPQEHDESEQYDQSQEYDEIESAEDESAESTEPREGCDQQGHHTCNSDGSFSICNNGALVKQACGVGQDCQPSDGSIRCVAASQLSAY